MTITELASYKNGNADIKLYSNGTREISYPNSGMVLQAPLNVDIKVSSKCEFGMNPATNKAFCDFCHESARQDGVECDYSKLKDSLLGMIQGTEIAVGSNEYTSGLNEFLLWAKAQGFFCNVTVNQGHLKRDWLKISKAIKNNTINGLGVSYRAALPKNTLKEAMSLKNSVLHVIGGIDCVDDILSLKKLGVKKILVLGEKDFGFNQGSVDLNTDKHFNWRVKLRDVLSTFDVVSFDNLAIEQFKPQRFVNNWKEIYQGEHSFYIDAVAERYKPSSRSFKSVPFSKISFLDYFKSLAV